MDLEGGILDRWSGGQLMAFSGVDGSTDFYHGLTARTAFDAVAIDVKLPGTCRILLSQATPGTTLLTGDCFELHSHHLGSCPPGQTSSPWQRGAFLDAHHLLIEGPCQIEGVGPEITVFQEGARTLVASAPFADPRRLHANLDEAMEARKRWLESLSLPDRASTLTRRAIAKAFSQMKTMVYGPEGILSHHFTTPDRWPHQGMWLWDSAFHAIGYRHLNITLAREILEAVFDGQLEDGKIPIRTDPAGKSESPITQPPVLALAVQLLQETAPSTEWLERVYPKLAA